MKHLILAALLMTGALRAQLVNDGATNTQNNTTNTFTGDVTIGTNGPFTFLTLTNNALLTNSFSGVIGRNTGANSNTVWLASAGARWFMGSNLLVGSNGSFNRLLLSGVARDSVGYLGVSFGSSSNLALVAGAGAAWSNSSDLFVGVFGIGNRLVVSNGGVVQSKFGYVGYDPGSTGNVATVTGTNSLWNNAGDLFVGNVGTGNQLIITNGGMVRNTNGLIGGGSGGNNNTATVTGPGSLWNNVGSFFVGYSASGNRLLVNNGGAVLCNNGHIGLVTSNNVGVVTGAGSMWSNAASLVIGNLGGGNQFVVSNSANVFANTVFIGLETNSTANRVVVDGGSLHATNATATSIFDIRHGTNVLNSGLMDVDRLVMTNAAGVFEFNGGTLSAGRTTNNNGRAFTAGNGTNAATFQLRGGMHFFSNGLVISSNASLLGNGTVVGAITVRSGGALAPGLSVGTLSLSNSPLLQGAIIMEISRDGSLLTNDQIQVAGALTYGGSLTISNIGSAALAAGDRFILFKAAAYAGAFATISLPPLGAGFSWTNKLLLDGSMEVLALPAPRFGRITLSGTNLIVTGTNGQPGSTCTVLTSTNVAQPLSNWTSIVTRQFGPGGSFSFTNSLDATTAQRFFLLRTP